MLLLAGWLVERTKTKAAIISIRRVIRPAERVEPIPEPDRTRPHSHSPHNHQMDPHLTYARSTAISPEHYKLVKAIEDAKSAVVSCTAAGVVCRRPGLTFPGLARVQHAQSILVQQLDKIRHRWQGSSLTSVSGYRRMECREGRCGRVGAEASVCGALPAPQKQTAHDLILILYASSQRTSTSSDNYVDGHDPLSVEFALAGAVNLAGGAAKLSERATGKRLIMHVLSQAGRVMKLIGYGV